MRRTWSSLTWVIVAVGACGGDGDGGTSLDASPGAQGPVAGFAPVAGEGMPWGSVPYPSDLYLDAAGRIALTTLPTGPEPDPEKVASMREALHDLDGFGVRSSVVFPVTGAVAAETVAAHAALVDLDGGLAPVAVDAIVRADLGAIVLVPRRGVVLRPARRYAAYLTDGVSGPSGALRAASGFAAAWSDAPAGEPTLERARASLAPLRAALPEAERDHVVAATVFRTHDVAAGLVAMRDAVLAAPPTIVAVDDVIGPAAAELDALFGPATTVTGWDAWAGAPQPHGHVAAVVQGRLELPSFIGAIPAGFNLVEHDPAGAPRVTARLTIPFTLVLPRATSYAQLPLVLTLTGVTSTRVDALVHAEALTSRGMALLAIDLPFHGDRGTSVVDQVNRLTGASVPDGFGDPSGIAAAVNFFHLFARGGVAGAHPGAMRDTLCQAATEVMGLSALARTGDLGAVRTALGAAGLPTDLGFRPQVGVLSISFGAMLGALAAAVDPSLDVVVSTVTPAGFPFPTLLHSPTFSPQFAEAVLGPFGVLGRTVLGDPVQGAQVEPIVMLWNTALEPGDPLAYAPVTMDGAARGDDGPFLLVLEAWGDDVVPNEATEGYAAALGLGQLVLDLPSAPPGPLLSSGVTLPALTAPTTARGVLTVWHPAGHGLIQNRRDVVRHQPVFPPFVPLAQPALFDGPIDPAEPTWAGFLADFFAGGPPRVRDPFAR